MLLTFKTMSQRYYAYMTYIGRHRVRDVLLQKNDRLLADLGISRTLLEQGVSAWPWTDTREEEDQTTVAKAIVLNADRPRLKEMQSTTDQVKSRQAA